MVAGKGHIAGVTLERGDERLGGVVPNLHRPVVRGRQQIGLVRLGIIVHVVDPFGLVGLQREVGRARAQTPDLHGPVQTGGGEGVCILGIDGETHDVVTMSLEHLNAFPVLLPVP